MDGDWAPGVDYAFSICSFALPNLEASTKDTCESFDTSTSPFVSHPNKSDS